MLSIVFYEKSRKKSKNCTTTPVKNCCNFYIYGVYIIIYGGGVAFFYFGVAWWRGGVAHTEHEAHSMRLFYHYHMIINNRKNKIIIEHYHLETLSPLIVR